MKRRNNHIFVDKDKPKAFVLVNACREGWITIFLSDFGFEHPDARIALVFQENGITTIELDNGKKHIGILGTWNVSDKTTHKFTCLDELSPVFGRAVTKKAVPLT